MGKRAFYERLIRGFINGDEARSVETARAHNEVFTPSKAWPALWEPWRFSRDLKS